MSKDFRRVSEILVVAVAVCTDAIHHGRMDWELPRGYQFVLYFWDLFVLFDDIDTSQQVLSVLRGQVVFARFFLQDICFVFGQEPSLFLQEWMLGNGIS